jgi:hypothetical protein
LTWSRLARAEAADQAGSLADRCLTGGLPEFGAPTGSFRRIVQTPGGVSIFYDVGQGQGWQRNIVMNGSPHLPSSIRQWYGDSRGHWDGNTLVVDVTNFSAKTDYHLMLMKQIVSENEAFYTREAFEEQFVPCTLRGSILPTRYSAKAFASTDCALWPPSFLPRRLAAASPSLVRWDTGVDRQVSDAAEPSEPTSASRENFEMPGGQRAS